MGGVSRHNVSLNAQSFLTKTRKFTEEAWESEDSFQSTPPAIYLPPYLGLLYRNRRSADKKTVSAVRADAVAAAVAGGAVFDTEGGGGGVRLEKRTGVYKSYKKLVAGVPLAESEYVRQLVEREGLGESSDENFIEVCIYMEKAQHNIRKEPYAIYEKNPSQYDLEVNT